MISTNTSTNFINVMNNFNTEEDRKELLDSPEFHDWMIGLLNEMYPVTVTFTKKDGTNRVMKCTRNMEVIPADKHPSGKTIESDSKNIKVFDLDKNEWRSFNQTSITRIEFTIE